MASSHETMRARPGKRPATITTPLFVVTAESACAQTSSGARVTGSQVLALSQVHELPDGDAFLLSETASVTNTIEKVSVSQGS